MFHAVNQSSLLSTSLVLIIGKQCHTINNSETSRSENQPAERLPENGQGASQLRMNNPRSQLSSSALFS